MSKTKIKPDVNQLLYIIQVISSKKADMILNACTRLNIYQLYSTIELEKKFSSKIMTKKKEYKIELNIVEAITLHDLLSGNSSDIRISKIFMQVQKFLPKIN
jgi:predicted RNA-binding protein Jag